MKLAFEDRGLSVKDAFFVSLAVVSKFLIGSTTRSARFAFPIPLRSFNLSLLTLEKAPSRDGQTEPRCFARSTCLTEH